MNCPKCQANPKSSENSLWECGSYVWTHNNSFQQSDKCRIWQLEAEVKRLQEWVDDCQSGMYINCVYCGHRYGPRESTPVTMADVLKAHIEQCPKHPLSHAKAEVKRLQTHAGAEYQRGLEEGSSAQAILEIQGQEQFLAKLKEDGCPGCPYKAAEAAEEKE